MKLGASYNLFDGEELLESSINSIRNNVDYISVVYQDVSNSGTKNDISVLPLLEDLKNKKLIDEYFKYFPSGYYGSHQNELTKRNIGLLLSKNNGCTHHISMDTDEFYDKSEFKKLKKLIEENNYDSSYCQMLTYFKNSKYVQDPPEEYYVSLIFKIIGDYEYVFNHPSPVLVDPTRRMNGREKPLICSRDQIQMHHLSNVRKNYRKKLENSSAYPNYKDMVEQLVDFYNKWDFSKSNMVLTNNKKFFTVKEVEDLFNIKF